MSLNTTARFQIFNLLKIDLLKLEFSDFRVLLKDRRYKLFRLDIITKAGILVFSHDFIENWLETEEDLDLIAGLKSAAISALRETQGETITEIKQVDYTLLLYEGILTFGFLTVKESDPVQHELLRKIVLKFELMFTLELHSETIHRKEDFEVFRGVVQTLYDDFRSVDVKSLRTIIEIISQSNASNIIICSTSKFYPLYTSMVDHSITLPLHKMTQVIRSMDDLCLSQKKETMTAEIDLQDIYFHAIRTKRHWVVYLSDSKRIDKFSLNYEINVIKNILSETPIISIKRKNNHYF